MYKFNYQQTYLVIKDKYQHTYLQNYLHIIFFPHHIQLHIYEFQNLHINLKDNKTCKVLMYFEQTIQNHINLYKFYHLQIHMYQLLLNFVMDRLKHMIVLNYQQNNHLDKQSNNPLLYYPHNSREKYYKQVHKFQLSYLCKFLVQLIKDRREHKLLQNHLHNNLDQMDKPKHILKLNYLHMFYRYHYKYNQVNIFQ